MPAPVLSPDSAMTPIVPAAAGGVRIVHVEPGSVAARLGLQPDDRLVALNGHAVADVIDYWYYGAAERIKVQWVTAAGEPQSTTVRKSYQERLGVELEPFEIRRCSNHCVFCFVHQLPPGMRRELYVKDEDYRLSFLYGNYITGTNLSPADKERIVRLKLSPLYFSVHATDQAMREKLLVKNNIEPIIPLLKSLTKKGIYVHAQIVLCPGENDGAVLERTVMELADLYPKLESIAVVPLGMTDHRKRLPTLNEVTPEYALRFISECSALQRKVSRKIGFPLVFPSDEFYLIAEVPPPKYGQYPEIPQLANGVGMFYRFYEHVDQIRLDLPTQLSAPARVAAITTHMGVKVLTPLVEMLNQQIAGFHLDLIPVTNSLFGEGITVSGLLPGRDFLGAITANPGYDRYLIPENALRVWDKRFLDDMLFEDLIKQTGVELVTGSDTAESFIAAALGPITPGTV